MKVLVSMCRFPVNNGSSGSIGIPGCLLVDKCDNSVSLFLYSGFDVSVDGVKMGIEFCEALSVEIDMAVINISVPALRRVECGV